MTTNPHDGIGCTARSYPSVNLTCNSQHGVYAGNKKRMKLKLWRVESQSMENVSKTYSSNMGDIESSFLKIDNNLRNLYSILPKMTYIAQKTLVAKTCRKEIMQNTQPSGS